MTDLSQIAVDFINGDRKYLKICIMYETIGNVPIFEAYRNFSRKFGNDAMSYPDFEFWFMRFSAGNLDLDYDRSRDPEMRTLLELPMDVMDIIIGELTVDEKLIFRKTSKSIMSIMDNQESDIKKVAFYLLHNSTTKLELVDSNGSKYLWKYEKSNFQFEKIRKIGDDNCLVSFSFGSQNETAKFEKVVKNSFPGELLLADFCVVMKNSTLVLDKLEMTYLDWDYIGRFHKKMSKIERKIKVRHLKMDAFGDQQELAVLPYLDIRDTVEITFYADEAHYKANKETKRIRTLVESEQWASAKTRRLSAYVQLFPFEVLADCDHLELELRMKCLREEQESVQEVLQILLTSTVLQRCKIYGNPWNQDIVKEMLSNLGYRQCPNDPDFHGRQFSSSEDEKNFTIKVDHVTEIKRNSL